jgi:hypothetical protein
MQDEVIFGACVASVYIDRKGRLSENVRGFRSTRDAICSFDILSGLRSSAN